MSADTARHENAVARCFAAWNTRRPEALAKAVDAAWAADAGYTDPLADAVGHEPCSPGNWWAGTAEPLGRRVAPVAGSDVITLDAWGRITAVLGFLDRVPAESRDAETTIPPLPEAHPKRDHRERRRS
ncbi:nuclear transport factor 2 family protein [Streptomyces sp. NBC_00704]|uniref:nuclear transport factor 2 family protein n=1 Tax=Streptomyces sp. NBC_00704 TaxID=2975809 RepID=UPI003FA73212